MKFFVINIDDEISVDEPGIGYVNYSNATHFVEGLQKNEEIKSALDSPETQILISIDEHLPWNSYQGRDIYEFLGLFTRSLPLEVRNRIFPIGITSSSLGQRYMPPENRSDKNFFSKLSRPEIFFSPDKLKNSADIFKDTGYYDYQRNEMSDYSSKAYELYKSTEGSSELINIK